MKKIIFLSSIICFLFLNNINAQVRIGMGLGRSFGGGFGRQRNSQRNQQNRNQNNRYQDTTKFTPSIHFNFGYALPNLDKNTILNNISTNYYIGNISTQNPINFGINYQFNRSSSIGLMATKASVNIPFYSNISQANPDFVSNIDNWSLMLNYTSYFDTKSKVLTPYLKTAVGLNLWNQNSFDNNNNKLNINYNLPDFAYQISIGTNIYINKNFGFFVEAGIGKYILNTGLSFKF